MESIWKTIKNGYGGYASYLWREITEPNWHNYFYWLIGVSLFFFLLEVVIPWRKNQSVFRKDFWLDAFYMFFNFFLFSLIIYNAASDVVVNAFNSMVLSITSVDLKSVNPMYQWPMWAILLTGFLVRDFVQWWVHRLLHTSPRLWEFHKIHHSVEEMGFAAHLRYHWMETIVYRTIEYLPLALLGIGLYDFFAIHIFTLAIGHYNHSNISIDGRITGGILGLLIALVACHGLADIQFMVNHDLSYKIMMSLAIVALGSFGLGPFMKKIFNSPEMHIWHHAYHLPEEHHTGVNFGLSLAIWDYIFGTDYIPKDGKTIELGFPGVEKVPSGFIGQSQYGFQK